MSEELSNGKTYDSEATWKITRPCDWLESTRMRDTIRDTMIDSMREPVYLKVDSFAFTEIYGGNRFKIKQVIFNNPATIVYWKDGSKTVVTDMDNVADGKIKAADSYSKETGLALCFMKKALGNKGNYNNAFREWIKED